MASHTKANGGDSEGTLRSEDHFTRGSRDWDARTARIVERVKSMTPEEFRESLLTAGIITKTGKLAKPYRS